MAQVAIDLLYSLTNCIFCFPSSPQLKVNDRSFKILRLLGEGGFSYVYLVEDTRTSELFALKKIRCPFGQESVAQALKEAEAYALFSPNDNIIVAVDYAVQDARDRADPGSKTVYILLPYYRRGNLQDAINANLVNHTSFPERHLLQLFLGIAKGLKAMHQYRVRSSAAGKQKARQVRQTAGAEDRDAARKAKGSEVAQQEDDAEAAAPLMEADGDMGVGAQAGVPTGDVRAYAHRDIKPGNIMIADDGATPVLMDLGSLAASPVAVTSRSLAIAVQEQAAEHSTMPYRAPELFDVKTDTVVDTKTDVWSVGCTLYACLVGKSPFEARSEETGGSLSMCVLGGDWRFPDEGGNNSRRQQNNRGSNKGKAPAGSMQDDEAGISDAVKDIVRACLRLEPAERPDVDALIEMIEHVLDELPEDGGS